MNKDQKAVEFWLSQYITPWDVHLTGLTHVWAYKKTAFQDMYIVETPEYGKVLLLDSDWQSAQADEFLYHESLVHPAMICHAAPRNVLILGGGEGATAREVLRWQTVERVMMVDIDGDVVAACQTYLPEMHAGAFEDPRLEVRIDDAFNVLEQAAPEWDVILFDLADPTECGPAYKLFTQECFAQMRRALKPNGVLALQAGSLAPPDLDCHARLAHTVGSVFPHLRSYGSDIPSFMLPWGFILASAVPIPDQPEPDAVDQLLQEHLTGSLKMLDGIALLGLLQTRGHVRGAIANQTQIYTLSDPPKSFGRQGIVDHPLGEEGQQLQANVWFRTALSQDHLNLYAHGATQMLAAHTTAEHEFYIFETGAYGKAMILDGYWQASTADAYLYYEPLVHPALIYQGDPRRVLILGDNIGAAVREVLRWDQIEAVVMVGSDAEVVAACRQHLPELQSGALDDQRVQMVIDDVETFLSISTPPWDIIISDLMTTEPSGVPLPWLTPDWVSRLHRHLHPKGVLALQVGAMSVDLTDYRQRLHIFQSEFGHVLSYSSFMPSQGQPWGFLMASEQGIPTPPIPEQVDQQLAAHGVEGLQMMDGMTLLGLMQAPKHIRNDKIINESLIP